MWDLNYLTRDRTCAPCGGSRVLTTGLPGSPFICSWQALHIIRRTGIFLLSLIQMWKFRHISRARMCVHTHTHTHTPLSPQVILWLPRSMLWSHLLPLTSFLGHNKSCSIVTTVSLEQELLDSFPRTSGEKVSISQSASWSLEFSVLPGPFLSLLPRSLLPVTSSDSCTVNQGTRITLSFLNLATQGHSPNPQDLSPWAQDSRRGDLVPWLPTLGLLAHSTSCLWPWGSGTLELFLLQLTSDQEEVGHTTQMGAERPKQDTDQAGLERTLTLHSRQRLENLLTSLYFNG